jgi:hypothetical protein
MERLEAMEDETLESNVWRAGICAYDRFHKSSFFGFLCAILRGQSNGTRVSCTDCASILSGDFDAFPEPASQHPDFYDRRRDGQESVDPFA